MIMIAQTAVGIGLFISSFTKDVSSATAIAPVFTMPMILFGGFITNTSTTPAWLAWIQWISPIRYGNEALAHTQYDDFGEETLPHAYLELEGFTIGYWKCVAACLGFAIFWRTISLCFLTFGISKFQ